MSLDIQGHGVPCCRCGAACDVLAGDPGRCPLILVPVWRECEAGVTEVHCSRCVHEMMALARATVDFLKDKVECWLVWQRAPDVETGGRPYLFAVDMTEEQAKVHKASVEMSGGMAMIERSWINHAYGESMTVSYGSFRSMMAEFRDRGRGG